MTGRYVTDGEKAGQKRRMEAYRKRLRDQGIKSRQLLLTDAENTQVRGIVAFWRAETNALDDKQRRAAEILKPE